MEEAPKIRPARAEDLPGIVALLADDELGRDRERSGGPLDDAYLEAFAEIDRDARNELVVIEEHGRILATLQLTFLPSLSHLGGERVQIEGVRVATGHRGTGVGRGLLEWVVSRAEERGCRMVQLTTDKRRSDARRFYEGLGFEATHEGMKLRLPERPGV